MKLYLDCTVPVLNELYSTAQKLYFYWTSYTVPLSLCIALFFYDIIPSLSGYYLLDLSEDSFRSALASPFK